MTAFDNFMSMNMDELVNWLLKNGAHNDSPWERWWNNNYCKTCGAVTTDSVTDSYGDYWEGSHEFSWCELYGNCRYFQDMKKVPNRKQRVELWLNSEV